ncbi:MAG: hypothetical protein WAU78_12805 [Roseiarcus sp.]
MSTSALVVIDLIPAHLAGSPARIVAIDPDTGRFGLARRSAIDPDAALMFPIAPAGLAEIVAAARAAISGKPRVVTKPGLELDLAVGVLATAWKIGQMAEGLENMAAENRALGEERDALKARNAALAAMIDELEALR